MAEDNIEHYGSGDPPPEGMNFRDISTLTWNSDFREKLTAIVGEKLYNRLTEDYGATRGYSLRLEATERDNVEAYGNIMGDSPEAFLSESWKNGGRSISVNPEGEIRSEHYFQMENPDISPRKIYMRKNNLFSGSLESRQSLHASISLDKLEEELTVEFKGNLSAFKEMDLIPAALPNLLQKKIQEGYFDGTDSQKMDGWLQGKIFITPGKDELGAEVKVMVTFRAGKGKYIHRVVKWDGKQLFHGEVDVPPGKALFFRISDSDLKPFEK